jgi:alpha-glucosidase
MSNHDLPRAASRYSKNETDTQARLAMALLLTVRGTPFMYYGEEIGMRDISLRRDEILDPPGKKYWPIYKGRDGCRSPMQWDDSANAGFSSARPWLPVHPDYTKRNVDAQRTDPGSLLNLTRKLIALRRAHPALVRGDFSPIQTPAGVLAFSRGTGSGSILVALNFSKRSVKISPPGGDWQVLFQDTPSAHTFELAPGSINLFTR